jgi:hypothetical protein
MELVVVVVVVVTAAARKKKLYTNHVGEGFALSFPTQHVGLEM